MSRRSPAFCAPWPWQLKQLVDRIGRTSQFQSGRSGMAWVASATWPALSWAQAARTPAAMAATQAPVIRLNGLILAMRFLPLPQVRKLVVFQASARLFDSREHPSAILGNTYRVSGNLLWSITNLRAQRRLYPRPRGTAKTGGCCASPN